jgi:acetyl esterase/lipase
MASDRNSRITLARRLLWGRLRAFVFLIIGVASSCRAQSTSAFDWAAGEPYRMIPNITYGIANNYVLQLDIWRNKVLDGPLPTVIYIHGGGWIGVDRASTGPLLIPYLAMGWNVVNVEYRTARVSLAPAAVEDCRCALRWVIHNAQQYHFDVTRLIVSGNSAGGQLALMTGLLTPDAGLDSQCPGDEPLRVAAIVNWFGITDVADLLAGPDRQDFAVTWLGSRPDRMEVAKRVSPLTYVHSGAPPVITIHGDADRSVPYSQAVRLHEALNRAGVPNELVTIPGGGHGSLEPGATRFAYRRIREFLEQHGLRSLESEMDESR